MTPRQRVAAAVERREPDRVPVFPYARAFHVKNAGFLYADVVADTDKYTAAAILGQRELGLDAVEDNWSAGLFAEAFGASIIIHEDDPPSVNPSVQETALAELADVERIPAGEDFLRHPRIQYGLRAIARLRRALDRDVPLAVNVPTPFLMAGLLRNIQAFMLDLVDRPEFVRALLEKCVGNCVDYGRAAIAAGGDYVLTMNPFAGGSCISRRHYLEFNHPYAGRFFQGLRRDDIRIIYHMCGDWTDRLDLVVAEGPDVCFVDRVDLEVLKKEHGDRVAAMGNVRTVETLLQGTPDRVQEESAECIRKAAGGGGYLLSGDCVIARDTPKENLVAMVKAAGVHGVYS